MKKHIQSISRLLVLTLVFAALFGMLQMARGADNTPNPKTVTVVGTVQSKLGCPGDWQPECTSSMLTYDAASDVWIATFDLVKGNYEYKAAINGNWTENYGADAAQDGKNLPLAMPADGKVTFVYDHKTHVVAYSINPAVAGVIGTFQKALGCAEDNQPLCLRAWLQDPLGAGDYLFTTNQIPVGDYTARVALNQSKDEIYGAGGEKDGAEIAFTVTKAKEIVNFQYSSATHTLTVLVGKKVAAPKPVVPRPELVVVPGTIQSKLGCDGDWQPACKSTELLYDESADLFKNSFDLPAGSYEYKVAIGGTWDINYGQNGVPGGANITLNLAEDTTVTIIFDYKNKTVLDSVNSLFVVLAGSFQKTLGCSEDFAAGCFNTIMLDSNADGVYVFVTSDLTAGDYEAKVAINNSLTEGYGADGEKDGKNITFNVPSDYQEMYFGFDSTSHALVISSEGAPKGDLHKAKAHWLLGDTIAWKPAEEIEGTTFALYYSPDASLVIEPGRIVGGQSIPLTYVPDGLGSALMQAHPNLAAYAAFTLGAADLAKVPEILKGQFAVAQLDADGKIVDASGLQIAGVLDDLFAYDGALGVAYENGVPTLRVWAPTARSVALHLYPDSASTSEQVVPMTADAASGVWTAAGSADWTNQFYLYEVEVLVPSSGKIVKNLVTDPYSFSLSTNSKRSQIVDMADAALKPAGWDTLSKPALNAPEDTVIYELHIRDFSISDQTVPEELRGTYLAFTQAASNGMQHLKSLADAGLTHIHLLPAFDIASVNEDKSTWQTADPTALAAMPGDSEEQRVALKPFRDTDGFNWGYDPLHYTTPEGSYATNPDGSTRIVEFRQMVQALNQTNLRVVMDVVYNHTNASGQNANSVLDKVVPGYYHRLNADGLVETSTCCQNTATENRMMEKLMIDSLIVWAKEYKVDGFRFDLMGHHMLSNMLNVRKALDGLTLEKDGVDGSKIILYGEGWDFGEVASNARGQNAQQLNLAGSGIGSFNDRLRDAVRGGGPFSPVYVQGFATGLAGAPNGQDPETRVAQENRLIRYGDLIRLTMAGNLKDFQLVLGNNRKTPGVKVDYNGKPAGYTADPQENVIYVSAHDNESIFDVIQYKAALSETIQERVRMNNQALSLVMFSQGMPFFHAGDDLLRSKSLDGNSYNSGDWYNKLDFTYQTNNWAVGLPDFRTDQTALLQSLLSNPALAVSPADIQFARQYFLELLQIRKSSTLFRMQTAELINQKLSFLNVGANQIPGVVVMLVDDTAGERIDPNYAKLVVVANSLNEPVTYSDPALQGLALVLHPIQAGSVDPLTKASSFDAAAGSVTVAGRTTAVFVVELAAPMPTATPTAAPTETPKPTEAPTAYPIPVMMEDPGQPTAYPASESETAEGSEAGEGSENSLPWLPLGIGAGILAAGGAAYLLLRNRKK